MSNSNIVITIIVILVLAIGGYFLFANKAAAPATTVPVSTTASTTMMASSSDATTTVVTYTDKGFSPNIFTVALGTTVRFVNNSSGKMWVAVGNHPTHTLYDGTSEQQHCTNGADNNGSFDECMAVDPGTVYSFTFDKAGTFPFHNHVNESDEGTITVSNMPSRSRKIGHLLLRIGVAFAFLYPPIDALSEPDAWIGYFPKFMLSLPIDSHILLHGFGILEVVIAFWILSGWNIRIPAIVATLLLVAIVAFNAIEFPILFRDIAIAFAALALAFMPRAENA